MVRCGRNSAMVVLALLVGGWWATARAVAAGGDASAGAFAIPMAVDSGGHVLDGSAGRYTLAFTVGELPPVRGHWSLAMYSLPDQLLVANPLGRYSIDSPMLPNLKRDADGGLTIYIQQDEPGEDKAANWLPAPGGPFLMILRLYGAEQAVLVNEWEAPPVQRVESADISGR